MRRLPWAAPFESPAALGDVGEPGAVEAEGRSGSGRAPRGGHRRRLRAGRRRRLGAVEASSAAARSPRDPALVAKLVPAFVARTAVGRHRRDGEALPRARQRDGEHRRRRGRRARRAPSTLRRDLAPFRSAIAAGVQLVMVSSASYPALDPAAEPAMFSRPIVTGAAPRGSSASTASSSRTRSTLPPPRATPHAPARAIGAGVDLLLYTGERASEARLREPARGRAGKPDAAAASCAPRPRESTR